MLWRTLVLLLCAMLCIMLGAQARPLYTDVSNKTLALVLCANLHDAVLALKQREVLEHAIGAQWLEENCVSIDPSTQRSSNEDPIFGMPLPVLAGVCLLSATQERRKIAGNFGNRGKSLALSNGARDRD